MKRTKIVCTIGPACEDERILTEMIKAGMNVARLNFSHGTHEDHRKKFALVKSVREKMNAPVAIMLDTKGPEYRIGTFQGGKIALKEGDFFTFTTEDVAGDRTKVSVSYKNLIEELQVGDKILLNNGLLIFEVTEISGCEARCIVLAGGELSDRKSMSFPNKVLNQIYLSEQDKADILLGIELGVDFIACSFVSQKQDVLDIRNFLKENGGEDIDLIAKIENQEGVDNIDDILQVVDGVMVARGDLGVEIPMEDVPIVQKEIIAKCNALGKPVVTATQMLESMITNYRATRAEANDIANSIFDGTDAIMLSGETASGAYPLEAVQTMARIAKRTEDAIDYVTVFKHKGIGAQVQMTDAISHATVQIAQELEANAIMSITESGYTARLVAKYRPKAHVLGVSPKEESLRRMSLYWGVTPLKGENKASTDALIEASLKNALDAGLIKKGDSLVVTAGMNVGKVGSTNLIQVVNVGQKIVPGQGIGKKAASGIVLRVEKKADLEQFKPGMILAVAALENEMGTCAAQSGGIIAEEGGFTSPAAIIGINYGIPVIVGAKGAMEALETGDLVTLDVTTGSVYAGKINVK